MCDAPIARSAIGRSSNAGDRADQKLNWALNFTSRGCSTECGAAGIRVAQISIKACLSAEDRDN
jgi:hypothetical protein